MSSQHVNSTGRMAPFRKGALPIVLWAFGFATSLMLIGMWGRAVTVDTATIQETAQTIVDSDLAMERVHDWLEAGIATAANTDSTTATAIASAIATRPEFEAAVDVIVADFVAGIFADPGEDPVVRVGDALTPLVPVVVAEANRRAVPVEPQLIEEMLETASVIELDTGEAASVATVVDEARAVLTQVVVVSALLLALTAVLALALSDRRYAMLRTLSTRVLLSALTYALLFRVAAWALDPQKGRAPVLGGGSVLLGSNGHVFVIAAAIALVLGAFGGTVARHRTTPRAAVAVITAEDEDTREMVAV